MKDFAAIFLSLIFLVSVWFFLARRQALFKEQPVAYNHKKHIDLGLECAACHTGILEGRARAGIPNLETCLPCHTQDDTNPKTKIIQTYASEKKPIPWKRVYRVPGHVYFSHRRHVAIARLDCAVCHGDMIKKETPVSIQAVPIQMGRCIDCHGRMKVSNDCLVCHR